MKPDVKLGLMLANTKEPILDPTVIVALLDDAQRADSVGRHPTYGLIPDGVISTLTSFSSASAYFTSSQAGDSIRVDGGGAAGADLNTTIASVQDSTHLTLTANGVNGTGLTYKITPASYVPTYDLNFAAARGWRLKAAAVAAGYDFQVEQKLFNRSQMFRQFMQLSQEYAKRSRPTGSLVLNKTPRSYLLGRDAVYVATPGISQGELLEELESGL